MSLALTVGILLISGSAVAFLGISRQFKGHNELRLAATNFERDLETLEKLQTSYFENLNNFFSLKPSDFSAQYDVERWEYSGLSGSVQWWDEKKGSKLTGVSLYSYNGNGAKNRASYNINVWMGPTLLVPNFVMEFGYKSDGFFVNTDYIARGPYPFGSDQNYLDSFYSNKYISSYYDEILKQPGVVQFPPSPSFAARSLRHVFRCRILFQIIILY